MATPTADQYSVASGETLRAGRFGPEKLLSGAAAAAAVASAALASAQSHQLQGAAVASASAAAVFPSSVTYQALNAVSINPVETQAGTRPWMCGLCFGVGEIPSGQVIGASGIQLDVRNRHADGSLAFAVVSGVTTAAPVALLRGTSPASGAALSEPTTAQLQVAVAFTNVVDYVGSAVAGGAFTANWSDARNNGAMPWSRTTAHKVREIVGPVMGEWHYHLPTPDPHTWLQIIVRAAAGSTNFEVTTRLRNGWTQLAAPGSRTFDLAISINGTSRYTGTGIVHYHNNRWMRTDYVDSANPWHVMTQDIGHARNTGFVPSVSVPDLDASVYSSVPSYGPKLSAWTRDLAERPPAFHGGNIDADLGAGGYTDGLGELPVAGVVWYATAHPGAYWSIVGTARGGLGTFAMYYTDETTGRPVRASQYPTLGINSVGAGVDNVNGSSALLTPAPSGGIDPRWNGSGYKFSHGSKDHYPAYLLTGRYEFMEDMQLVCAAGAIGNHSAKYAGQACPGWWWQPRTTGGLLDWYGRAARMSPERYFDTPLAAGADLDQTTECRARWDASVDRYWSVYIAGTGTENDRFWSQNVFGTWYHGTFDASETNSVEHSAQQIAQISNGWVWNYLSGTPTTNISRLEDLVRFSARMPIGLMGEATGWGDWRLWCFYSMVFGLGPRESEQTPFASWAAAWSFFYGGAWQGGVNDVDALPVNDTHLRRFSIEADLRNVGSAGGAESFEIASDSHGFAWLIAGLVAASQRTSIPGMDVVAGRFYQSASWVGANWPGGNFRSGNPGCAVTAPVPTWAGREVGRAVLAPMSGSPDSVMSVSAEVAPFMATAGLGDYSSSIAHHADGFYATIEVHGGGHAACENNGVFGANANTRAWRATRQPTDLQALGKFVNYRTSGGWTPGTLPYDAFHTSYGYFVWRGSASTGWADPMNASLQELPSQTFYTNACEYAPDQPGSPHSYRSLAHVPAAMHVSYGPKGALLRSSSSAVGVIAALPSAYIHGLNIGAAAWWRSPNRIPNNANLGGPCAAVLDWGRRRVWRVLAGGGTPSPATYLDVSVHPPSVVSSAGDTGYYPGYADNVLAVHHVRADIIVQTTSGNGAGAGSAGDWRFFAASGDGATRTAVTWASGAPPAFASANGNMRGGLVYVERIDRIVYYRYDAPNEYIEITVPATPTNAWSWTTKSISGVDVSALSPAPHRHWVTGIAYSDPERSLIATLGSDTNQSSQYGGRRWSLRVAP